MPQKLAPEIVVGVDGSTSSVGAARWAAAVAAKTDAPLRLVHSLPSTGHHISDAAVVAIRASAPDEQQGVAVRVLARAEEAVHQHFSDVKITTEAVWDPADDALVRAGKTASLVVIGCDEVSPTAALLVGATSLAVATHAACPVVVWRGIAQPDDGPVVVGVDATPAGEAALAAAFQFADTFGLSVRAVHAWTIRQESERTAIPYFIDWGAVAAAESRFLSETVQPWRQRYPHVEVECLVEQAKTGRALLQHSAGAQLVVVGNHWRSAVASVLLGSTSLNMLHHSRIPVMVCHASEDR
jgi:nucleotide-binding universal stress UspA family protein